MLVFPDLKNLHLEGVTNLQDLQSMLQIRFANLNTKDTLKIYSVPEKSLSQFRPKNRYGFTNFPHESCRLVSEEIQGSDDIDASSTSKSSASQAVTPSKGDDNEIFDSGVDFDLSHNRFSMSKAP